MLKLEMSESSLQELRKERYNHPHPRVMLKMEVVYLKGLGLKNDLVCRIAGVCENTMREYLRQYTEGGIARLKEVNFYRPNSALQAYSGTLEQYFTEHPPHSIGEAAVQIKEITGVARRETQVRKFLKSLNFRFRKVGSVPAKVLTEEKKTSSGSFWKKRSPPA